MKQPFNVWRVYADVFSNLMGLVLAGGLGLMIMFGGALAWRFSSDNSFPSLCPAGARIQQAFDGNDMLAETYAHGCDIEVERTAIYFSNGNSSPISTARVPQLCRAILFAAGEAGERGVVEIIGHASPDTTATATAICTRRLHETKSFEAVDEQHLKRVWCNSDIAMRRALWVSHTCGAMILDGRADEILGLPEGPDQMTRRREIADRIAIVSQSSTRAYVLDQQLCRQPDTSDCQRTVTVRVRVTPETGV